MTNMSQPGIVKNMLRTTGIFAGLLTAGSLLIYFGTRNDAVTVARSIKAGVLTADEVNTAFQNVGGRLVERPIIESQHVKKGEVLAKLDGTDTRLAMASAEAVLAGLEASLRLKRHRSKRLSAKRTARKKRRGARLKKQRRASRPRKRLTPWPSRITAGRRNASRREACRSRRLIRRSRRSLIPARSCSRGNGSSHQPRSARRPRI